MYLADLQKCDTLTTVVAIPFVDDVIIGSNSIEYGSLLQMILKVSKWV
jgi:hypothetical protein